ncbi:MAG: DUF3109 family protein [Bacteroidales bacterium]|nr:DUF3109 family protein [Bacteroidales bacterium]
MFAVGKCLISDDIKDKCFCCNLADCKGCCCVEGDMGAPLEEEEISLLEDYIERILPLMTKEGQDVIRENGTFEMGITGEYVTPLINDRDCAYIYYDNGIAKCCIETAYGKGLIPFNKPISCHLYPIRLSKYKDTIAVNYDEWEICKDAVRNGRAKGIKLYEFLKDPLIRKFGEEWYEELLKKVHE